MYIRPAQKACTRGVEDLAHALILGAGCLAHRLRPLASLFHHEFAKFVCALERGTKEDQRIRVGPEGNAQKSSDGNAIYMRDPHPDESVSGSEQASEANAPDRREKR